MVAHSGDVISEKRQTCIDHATGTVNVVAYRVFVNNDTGKQYYSLRKEGETQPRAAGNVTSDILVPLVDVTNPSSPQPLEPGSYHLEGADKFQGEIRLWSSTSFQVVP